MLACLWYLLLGLCWGQALRSRATWTRFVESARSAESKVSFISVILLRFFFPFPACPSCCCWSHIPVCCLCKSDLKPQKSFPAHAQHVGLLPCSECSPFPGAEASSLSAPNAPPAASSRPSAGSARAAASPPEQKKPTHVTPEVGVAGGEGVCLRRPRLCGVGQTSTWSSWVVCWRWSCFAASSAAALLLFSHFPSSVAKCLFVTSRRLAWAWFAATWGKMAEEWGAFPDASACSLTYIFLLVERSWRCTADIGSWIARVPEGPNPSVSVTHVYVCNQNSVCLSHSNSRQWW